MDQVIPVSYKNLPPGVTIPDSIPEEISVKIQDKGIVLFNYYIGRKYNPVEIDLEDLNPEAGVYKISRSEMEVDLYKRFLSSTTLLSFSPESFSIYYTPLQKKEVPVVMDGVLNPALGFLIDTMELSPPVVTIRGDADALDSIHAVFTEKIHIENIDEKLVEEFRLLSPAEKIRMDAGLVTISVSVEEYTEKSFSIPIRCLHIPDGYNVRLFPSNAEIICQTALDKYQELTDAAFDLTVDYDSLMNRNRTIVPVTLSKRPEFVKNYRIVPESVEFLVEQK